MSDYDAWTSEDAVAHVRVPEPSDDKYSRGVLGIITGSAQYHGAAVLGVEAALHTGVGMVRYIGPKSVGRAVLARRPEAVTSNGRVQAWLIGSGMDQNSRSGAAGARMTDALLQRLPMVLDGGAFDLHTRSMGPTVITPHYRELARVLQSTVEEIVGDPAAAAAHAADTLGVTVLLKGHTSYIAAPGGRRLSTSTAPSWLATAGAGDALGGILGALVATHSDEILADPSLLAPIAATACVLHGLAAERASGGGPFTILDLTAAVPPTIAQLLSR